MNGLLKSIRRSNKDVCRIEIYGLISVNFYITDGIKSFNQFNFITKKVNLKRKISIARENIDNIPKYTKISTTKISCCSRIKALNQSMHQLRSWNVLIS